MSKGLPSIGNATRSEGVNADALLELFFTRHKAILLRPARAYPPNLSSFMSDIATSPSLQSLAKPPRPLRSPRRPPTPTSSNLTRALDELIYPSLEWIQQPNDTSSFHPYAYTPLKPIDLTAGPIEQVTLIDFLEYGNAVPQERIRTAIWRPRSSSGSLPDLEDGLETCNKIGDYVARFNVPYFSAGWSDVKKRRLAGAKPIKEIPLASWKSRKFREPRESDWEVKIFAPVPGQSEKGVVPVMG